MCDVCKHYSHKMKEYSRLFTFFYVYKKIGVKRLQRRFLQAGSRFFNSGLYKRWKLEFYLPLSTCSWLTFTICKMHKFCIVEVTQVCPCTRSTADTYIWVVQASTVQIYNHIEQGKQWYSLLSSRCSTCLAIRILSTDRLWRTFSTLLQQKPVSLTLWLAMLVNL